jgi:hypothetical protein
MVLLVISRRPSAMLGSKFTTYRILEREHCIVLLVFVLE